MVGKTYRLPTGEITEDVDDYVDEWQALGESVEWATGGKCGAFDPGFVVFVGDNSRALEIPVFVARHMAKLRNAAEDAQ